MTPRDDQDQALDADLVALYRASAVETPSAHLDRAVLAAAAGEIRRARFMPWAALAATLVLAAMLAPLAKSRLATSYDHEAAEAYLLQVQAPITPDQVADPADAYLLELPAAGAAS